MAVVVALGPFERSKRSGDASKVIELREVSHQYQVHRVLRGIDLRIEAGEVVVLLGPNGQGKTTLLSIMGGALTPLRGEVLIEGRLRRSTPEDELAIRRRCYYLPDKPWLPGNRTGREFLYSVGRIYEIEPEPLVDHIERLLELFELTEQGNQPIRSYSAGQVKKIGLCSALVSETPILLMDEPFSGGLDPSALYALKRLFQQYSQLKQKTVVLTSPVPEIVEDVASRIVILEQGRVLAFESIEGLKRLTQCHGSLSDVLEKLIHREAPDRVARYFEGQAP